MITKITIITSYFAPAWAYGGPPKVLFTLAKELVKSGIKVNVITTDSLGNIRSDKLHEKIEGIEINRFKNFSNYLAYKEKLFYAPNILSKVKSILSDTDLVLFSDVRSVFNWQFYGYLKKIKIPYGIFSYGQIPYDKGIKSAVKKLFDIVWVKDFIKNATYRLAQTEHEREMFKSYFGIAKSNVDLLPLPVEIVNDKPSIKDINQFRNKWKIGLNDKVIIFVGRINYLKGIDILIISCRSLLKSDPQTKLLIVGRDDGYLPQVKKIIPEYLKRQIIFTGPLYGKEVKVAYAISSCFAITPRFVEETSTASLEALSYGLPIVITKEAEVPYLCDYNTGYLVNNDSISISNAIKKIIFASTEEKKVMRSESLRIIQDHFQVEIVAKQLMKILSGN